MYSFSRKHLVLFHGRLNDLSPWFTIISRIKNRLYLLEFRIQFHVMTHIFCGIMPCSPLKANRRFVATSFHADFLLGLFLDPENWCDVPPKLRLTFNGLHGVISQKIELFLRMFLFGGGGVLCSSSGIRETRNKVQKPSNSEHYTPSSEPFRIYQVCCSYTRMSI
jgi:hypothetical protein